jgi:hypothetical protein
MIRNLINLGLVLCLFLTAAIAKSQDARLRVVLDPASFAGPTYQAMQSVADQVARVVGQMIPGTSSETTDVFCFAPPPEWGHAPITLVGAPQPGEPAASARYRFRVAVSRSVLPEDSERFAFQLAHELAHVRMDPRFDNEIIETFAVAVSFEVLERMGYRRYLQAAIQSLIGPLPPEIQAALSNRSWRDVNLYLKQQRQYHEQHPFDYSLATAGAVIIRAAAVVPWSQLSGIGLKNLCPVRADPPRFQFCALDESALPQLRPVFRLLGRATPSELASQRVNPGGN